MSGKVYAIQWQRALVGLQNVHVARTFNFIYFVNRTIHQYKTPTNYSFNSCVFSLI